MAKNQFNRLIWLTNTIYQAGHITFFEINRRWKASDRERREISLRTFHNHRVMIEDIFDINIECDKRSNEYYIADAEAMLGDSLKMWLLNSFSLANILKENISLKDRILFENVPAGTKFMDTIIEAMHSNRKLNINYQSYTWDEMRKITLEPYAIRLFKQRWYLIGFNTENHQTHLHALDRMQEVSLTDEEFTYPRKFVPRDYFKGCYGIIHDDNLQPVRTVLKVSFGQAPYLRDVPLHNSQKEIECNDQYSVFELTICHTYDFIKELLSYGPELVVVEPLELQKRMMEAAEKMLRNYKEMNAD